MPSEPLTPENLYAGPDLRGEIARQVQLSPDSSLVGWVQGDPDDPRASVLWMMPVAGGPATALLNTSVLGGADVDLSDAAAKALERKHQAASPSIDYRWSSSSKRLLVSCGKHLLLVDVPGGSLCRLDLGDGEKLDPQLAPGDAHVSYLRDKRLVIHEVASGTTWALGDDASDTVSYGTAEFIAQEEMRRFTGNWWSPDGRRLAYTRVDESGVRSIARIRIDAASTAISHDRFPLAGTPNADVQLFVRVASGADAVRVDLGPDPDIYLYDVAWSRDAQTLYAQRQSRDQRRLDLLAIDPRTGASRTLLTEVSDTWVDLERDFRPLEDGSFLWGSARSGWRHIYHYDEAGKLIRQVSSGKWRIAWGGPAAGVNFSPIVGVDEVAGEVYFAASIESPIEQHLYRIAFRRDDAPHRITQGSGWWRPTMAEGQPTAFVGDYSDPETPPQVGLYGLDGRRLAWLTENRLDETHRFNRHLAYRPTAQYDTLSPENGVDLHHVLIRPAGFDPSRRYPVIVRVYGGPGVQTVRREWRPLVEQLLTQAGYVVFQLDNRGTANRDSAFEHAQHRDLGGVSARDQLAGLRYLRSLSFVDPHRIGMMGWSFGGYLTLRTMATAGAELRAGAAGAAPSDFLLYDTHYTERFLGHPDVNVSAYRDDALLPRVKELHGDLLLIHGLSDDNVILANFTALVAALQQQGTLFDLAVYPGQGHAFRGEKPLVHLWKTYLRFFERTLAPGSDQLP